MLHRGLSIVLLACSLFSGQIMANVNGHDFWRIHNPDHLLRHDADSDDIRARSREAADALREDHHQVKSRRPETTLR